MSISSASSSSLSLLLSVSVAKNGILDSLIVRGVICGCWIRDVGVHRRAGGANAEHSRMVEETKSRMIFRAVMISCAGGVQFADGSSVYG